MNAAEWLLLSTIRIKTTIPKGVSTGTGFFFSFCVDEKTNTRIPTIVTNKHVIKNAINGNLRFSLKNKSNEPIWGQFFDLIINDFENKWIMHPDSNIDLCVLPIGNIHHEIEKSQKNLYYTFLTLKDIPSKDEIVNTISRVEDITIVGYPDGIWDSYNNMPIVRRGITATSLQLDFNNEPKFLVDAAIYGGSSGSPVYIFNQGAYPLANGGLVAGTRLKLVGIIHAVAQHTVNGDIKVVDIPAVKTPIATTLIPNNLGVAIHARELKVFETILKKLINKFYYFSYNL